MKLSSVKRVQLFRNQATQLTSKAQSSPIKKAAFSAISALAVMGMAKIGMDANAQIPAAHLNQIETLQAQIAVVDIEIIELEDQKKQSLNEIKRNKIL